MLVRRRGPRRIPGPRRPHPCGKGIMVFSLADFMGYAREAWLVLDMLVQRYDEDGPSDRWFSCLSTQVSFLKQHLDGVSLFVDSCKGSFVTNDGEIPDIPSDYSK